MTSVTLLLIAQYPALSAPQRVPPLASSNAHRHTTEGLGDSLTQVTNCVPRGGGGGRGANQPAHKLCSICRRAGSRGPSGGGLH
ncbi:hypothetical protein E2C01_071432 [Portunus trituberculatus]|uniref:Secreted protein n=1 Tax=Portunus trituberculatus TaxID=210409 RepID=A0A5B7I4F2_PORTR|nr:hypothetical protein [Portunus trituberculatus]